MNNIDLVFSNAFDLFNEKKYYDSIMRLKEAEQINDQLNSLDWKVCIENLKGFNFLSLNLLDQANLCFEKALQLDEKSSQACAGLAEVFFLKKQDKEAKTMFEYALLNNPKNQFAINGLANVNGIFNLPAEHNSLIEEEEVKIPDFRNVVIESSELFSNGQFEQAIDGISSIEGKIESDLVDLIELMTELMNMKGTAYLNLNQLEEARLSFEKALNFTPDSSTACWGLGEIFYRTSMFDEAKTMYEWALKHENNNLAAKEGISKVNKALGVLEDTGLRKTPTLRLASGKTIELE